MGIKGKEFHKRGCGSVSKAAKSFSKTRSVASMVCWRALLDPPSLSRVTLNHRAWKAENYLSQNPLVVNVLGVI